MAPAVAAALAVSDLMARAQPVAMVGRALRPRSPVAVSLAPAAVGEVPKVEQPELVVLVAEVTEPTLQRPAPRAASTLAVALVARVTAQARPEAQPAAPVS